MSNLHQTLEDYLAMRRSLGFKLRMAGHYLSDFVSFLEARQTRFITIALALTWAQLPSAADPSWWAQRLSYVRGFARYCRAFDPRVEIPPTALLPFQRKRAKPYFFTDEEIQHLLNAALAQPAAYGLQGWTYYCLLGLLTVTGLRIGEAIGLAVRDIDLSEGLLTIHAAKFGKSRLVPLDKSTQQVLTEYLMHRQSFLAGRAVEPLFVNLRGSRLEICQVHRVFRRLLRQVGVCTHTTGHGPRLHDLRHRFASTTLLHWYRDGQDVERGLPVLSAYLGHVNPSDTYWYLSAIPELMGSAKARLEDYWEPSP